jgi:uncharacterized protein YciI
VTRPDLAASQGGSGRSRAKAVAGPGASQPGGGIAGRRGQRGCGGSSGSLPAESADVTEGTYIYLTRPRPGFINSMTVEEAEIMDRHFAYLRGLLAEGRLVLAGPCLDGAFGVVIMRAPSAQSAREAMANDPAVRAGIMQSELHRFRVSLS